MLRLLAGRAAREAERLAAGGWREQLELHTRRTAAARARWAGLELVPRHNTPVMLEVMQRRAARMARRQADHTPEPSDDEEEGENRTRQRVEQEDNEVFRPAATPVRVQPRRAARLRSCPVQSSCLPTPATTAPSSPRPSSRRSGEQVHQACTQCNKEMNVKSLADHYRRVHKMKRPLTATPGRTPRTKRGRAAPAATTPASARSRTRVTVSQGSPEKIFNFGSPSRPVLKREVVGNIVQTFCRGLTL